jgi:flagellar assembly protein FliH
MDLGQLQEALAKKKKLEHKAKILRGQFNEETSEKESSIKEKIPLAVARGMVDLEQASAQSSLKINYNPQKFEKTKVETLQELTKRHQTELENLKTESEQKVEMAFKEGHEKGFAEGYAKGTEEVKENVQKVGELLEAINQATTSYFTKIEDQLAEFGMKIARKLVGDVVENERSIAVKLAKEAILHASDRTSIILLCNKLDYETLRNAKADLKLLSEGIKSIEVEISHRVSPGSVILETNGGSIDATIETHLDEIHKSLLPEKKLD